MFFEILKASKGLYTDNIFAEMWGKRLAGQEEWQVTEITGYLPLTFLANGDVLQNYRLYGTSEGAGVETENLISKDTFLDNCTLITQYERYIAVMEFDVEPNTTYWLKTNYYAQRYATWFITTTVGSGVVDSTINGVLSEDMPKSATSDSNGKLYIWGRTISTGTNTKIVQDMTDSDYIMLVKSNTAPASYIPFGYQLPLTNTSGVTKNLWNESQRDFSTNTILNDNGEIVAAGGFGYDRNYTSCEPETDYVISGTIVTSSTSMRLYFFDQNKTFISRSDGYGQSSIPKKFTTPANCYYVTFQAYLSAYDPDTIMITKGSTAPDHYIPHRYIADYNLYIGSTKLGAEEYVDYAKQKIWKLFEISGLSEPLCGINAYKDTLDLPTGTITRYIKKLVLTGTENWVTAGTNAYFRISIGAFRTVLDSYDLFCSHFVKANISSTTTEIGADVYNSSSSNAATLNIRPSGVITLTEFKQFLATEYANGTPVTVWYVLATPTTETITVPTGFTGTVEGYMSQSSTPTQISPIYPTANGEKQPNDTFSVFTLQPTDPPAPFPAIIAYKGENTLSSTETVGEVTVRGKIKTAQGG